MSVNAQRWICDAVKTLRCVQHVGIAVSGAVQGALRFRQLGGELGRARIQSIPESVARLRGQAGSLGDGALARAGQHAKRQRSRAGPAEQLAHGDLEGGLLTPSRGDPGGT